MTIINRDEIINSFYDSLPNDITDDEFIKKLKAFPIFIKGK